MLKNETKRKKNPKKTNKNAPAFIPSNAFPTREKRGFLFPGSGQKWFFNFQNSFFHQFQNKTFKYSQLYI
jgi:hypothetical protein